MEINNYKPFRKYSFYLDLQNSPLILNQLTKHINALGGKIDEFLNKKVNYIVTNRPKNVWPNRESILKSNPKFGVNIESNQLTHSPIAKNNSNKVDLFSRGKLLLSKLESDQKLVPNIPSNVSKKTPTTDVLELGRIWNIKIIQAIDMLEFCKKHLSPTLTTSSPIHSPQITQLRSPFIKIEDNQLKNRPNYKEFYEWPEINYEFHADLCPFIKKKLQKNIVESTQSLEGLAVNNKFNDKLTNHLNDKTKDETAVQTLIKKKVANKRRIPYYCEMCCTEYEDISKHLKSEAHETYTQNEENYRELRSVISSLPRFNDSNAKCMQFNNASDLSESDDESSSPFQSTPNMSTTIQFSGSKHKSHFLPIHHLIAQNNKSPEEYELDAIQTNQDSSNAFDFIPPSVSSVETTHSKINTYIFQSLNHKSETSENSNYELSEEYLIVN